MGKIVNFIFILSRRDKTAPINRGGKLWALALGASFFLLLTASSCGDSDGSSNGDDDVVNNETNSSPSLPDNVEFELDRNEENEGLFVISGFAIKFYIQSAKIKTKLEEYNNNDIAEIKIIGNETYINAETDYPALIGNVSINFVDINGNTTDVKGTLDGNTGYFNIIGNIKVELEKYSAGYIISDVPFSGYYDFVNGKFNFSSDVSGRYSGVDISLEVESNFLGDVLIPKA